MAGVVTEATASGAEPPVPPDSGPSGRSSPGPRGLWRAATAAYGAAWELRRRCYALGLAAPTRAKAGVVSVGNLAAGGTGKTTLTLHLAASLSSRGVDAAVVCRRYRPGAAGAGDEELLYAQALGRERVFAGRHKWKSALEASDLGFRALLVDDGFSHWRLERDRDLVLVDAFDPWAGGLLPAGRLREPLRALARADIVVLSHADRVPDLERARDAVRRVAPAAQVAAGRHRVTRLRRLDGGSAQARGAAHVVTGTGNPASVVRAARACGYESVSRSEYRDHHWFTAAEAVRERERASAQSAVIVLTAKDAVRWPLADDPQARVLEVAWEWMAAGDEVESRVADALRLGAAERPLGQRSPSGPGA